MNTTESLAAAVEELLESVTGKPSASAERHQVELPAVKLERLEASLQDLKRNMEDFFFVTFTILTFAMQCGFTFMEVGLVRTKNTTNVLLKGTIDAFVGCLSFWLFGYAIAWSDGNSFVGWNHFAFYRLSPDKYSAAFYQLIFSNTASTVVSGAVAERLNLSSYFMYGILLSGFGYPLISRWGWHDDGWLKLMGYRDYGGSGLVHLYSGACAFIAAVIIGPRIGRFAPQEEASPTHREGHQAHGQHIPGHSIPFVGLGALLLMFGFLGFNASSTLSITKRGDGAIVAYAAFNTLLGASAGALSALLINRFLPFWGNYWSYLTMVNGSLAGMVGICAGCDSLAPWAAVVTGILAGAVFILLRTLLDKLEVDDPIDAFPIHFGGGLVGLLSAPFLIPSGIFYKGDYNSAVMLGCNVLGFVVIVSWATVCCLPLFLFLRKIGILRVDGRMETAGMDVAKHNEQSYPLSAWDILSSQPHDGGFPVDAWVPNPSDKIDPPLVAGLTYRKRGGTVEAWSNRSMTEAPTMDLGERNSAFSSCSTVNGGTMVVCIENRMPRN